jgi:PTH1 family peptidyl-tRNA hydrolase
LRLVVGLGNPGAEYRASRHNLGFRVVEVLAERRGLALGEPFCGALVARGDGLLLAAPQTYMNRSGFAVRCLVEHEAPAAEEILVVFDDLALPLGRLRLRSEGGPGGHRGLASVLEQLRTDAVPRLRLGVGAPPPGAEVAEWVLGPFLPEEEEAVAAMVERAADACEAWLREPLGAVAARVNAPPLAVAVDGGPEA